MAKRIKLIDGDEQDALTPYKRHVHWHAHARKRIKRKYNRRERRTEKQILRQEDFNNDEESKVHRR